MHIQNMPPLVVLGLTGPSGSGCSAVGNQILRGSKLLKIFASFGWITLDDNGDFTISWNGLNEEIDNLYTNLSSIKKSVKAYKECQEQGNPDDLAKKEEDIKNLFSNTLHRQLEANITEECHAIERAITKTLRETLEVREQLKALDKLKPYYQENHNLFYTISASTIIVLYALRVIEQGNFNPDNVIPEQKIAKCKKFIRIAKKTIAQNNITKVFTKAKVAGFQDYYEKIYGWRDRSKAELVNLGIAFVKIYNIADTVKKEFFKNSPYDYIELLQDFGDNIRRCGNPFDYLTSDLPKYSYAIAENVAIALNLLYTTHSKAFFVIDCLRNPYEVIYLRKEFANFFLLSLYAEKERREKRFINQAKATWGNRYNEDKAKKTFQSLDHRDSGKSLQADEILYKQNVMKCVQISDIAINNTVEWTSDIKIDWSKDVDDLKEKISELKRNERIIKELVKKPLRVLCLILSPGCTKPNHDEMHMNMAYTMSVKSNCISRQVGAVIVGPKGYVVGAGWNDQGEGKISCGLRAIRDLNMEELRPHVKALLDKKENDEITPEDIEKIIKRLCHTLKTRNKNILPEQFCFCFKDEMAKNIVIKKLKSALNTLNQELTSTGKTPLALKKDELAKLVERAKVHQLESCLALHAEENAIIQSSKIGGMGLKEGTIYTTAEPCALCAKKIQQIGLKRVVYTEAYPQALSEVYMKDVKLEQFEGVKPRGYIRLFMPYHDQKEWQYLESSNLVPII